MFQTISNRINFEIQAPLHKAIDTATDDAFERLSFPEALVFRAICMGTLTVSTILDLTFKIVSIVEVIFVGSGNIVAAPFKGKSSFSKGINQLCDVPKDALKIISIPL